MARPKDVRLITIYGYARLIRYDENFNIVPDILECLEVENGGIFKLHRRQRHRWSGGQPFTSEEFPYRWEDFANNTELSPVGPPKVLRVGNELPNFEIVDDTTVRFTWSHASRYFLQSLARNRLIFIYRPSHYLRQFHTQYNDKTALNAEAQKNGMRNRAGIHNRDQTPSETVSSRYPPESYLFRGDRYGYFVWLAKRTGQSKFAPFRARAHTSDSIPMAEIWTIAETAGRAGAAPNTAAARKLLQLLDSWALAPLPADRCKI